MDNLTKKAGKIINRYKKIWMGLENVSAVGIGKTCDGIPCIIISLSRDDPATREIFPLEIEDIPIEFMVSGTIDAG